MRVLPGALLLIVFVSIFLLIYTSISCGSQPKFISQKVLLGDLKIEISWERTHQHRLPGHIDSNSPLFWSGDKLFIFTSASHPQRTVAKTLDDVVYREPLATEFIGERTKGELWMESVWQEQKSGVLYGWYHAELRGICPGTMLAAPAIGAAISYDYGLSWIDQGLVITSGHEIDCEYDNGIFVGGNGDFSVLLDQEERYFYFLFTHYGGPLEEQGIGLARSSFEDKGQPGTVFKYFNGSFQEQGLGGRLTPLFPTSTGWKGPNFDGFWGPAIHWNTALGAYVVVMNRPLKNLWELSDIYVSFSKDLLHWTEPKKIVEHGRMYPQIIGVGHGETDTRLGAIGRFYMSGISEYLIQFRGENK